MMLYGTGKLLLLLLILSMVVSVHPTLRRLKRKVRRLERENGALEARVSALEAGVAGQDIVDELRDMILNLQTQVQQLTRIVGHSGIISTRGIRHGSPAFTSVTQGLAAQNAMHNHANGIRTLGMGEVDAILNGVHFTSRHNDYKIVMPASIPLPIDPSQPRVAMGAFEDIEFPDVPPDVTAKATVDEEVAEMKEYFTAFAEQNITHRDYRDYFKPVLCYIEGYWTIPDADGNIVEPFVSDRHSIVAQTWEELDDRNRHSFGGGRRDNDENLPYLPTKYCKDENGNITKSHWYYRIMCHPISDALRGEMTTNRFVPIDDIDTRCTNRNTMEEHIKSRNARFRLHPRDADRQYRFGPFVTEFLDLLMEEIPGLDGYGNSLADENLRGQATMHWKTRDTDKSGYFGRSFREQKGGNGQRIGMRGFRDDNGFFAMNTQPDICPTVIKKRDQMVTQRWSYAIPLEVVYMTPLYKWNPYGILYQGGDTQDVRDAVLGTQEENDGSAADKAQNGTYSRRFYQTPWAFFDDPTGASNPSLADTGAERLYVGDPTGTAWAVAASGPRDFVWNARLRWPIGPMSWEGNPIHKVLSAHRECESCGCTDGTPDEPDWTDEQDISVSLRMTTRDGAHGHLIRISRTDALALWNNDTYSLRTYTLGGEHQHALTLKLNWTEDPPQLEYSDCDDNGDGNRCQDGHPKRLQLNAPFSKARQAYNELTNLG